MCASPCVRTVHPRARALLLPADSRFVSAFPAAQSGNFFGKLRSNFVGTEFTIYDKGAKPGDEESGSSAAQSAARRWAIFRTSRRGLLVSGNRARMDAVSGCMSDCAGIATSATDSCWMDN